jgi:drug/metabolite transporter (DMT)-like permease
MVYIFLALITYSVAMLFATYANRHANVSWVALIVNTISISVPLILLLAAREGSKASTKNGIAAAVAGGVLISLFTLLLGKSYELNNVAVVGPIVFGGSIVLTSIASLFLFKEKIAPLQGLGLVFVVIGLGLVVYSRIKAS